MIFELYEWLRTPCSPLARRLGYLQESIGIEARYRRHRDAWEPHLAASRALMVRAAEACGHHRRAVVLGSGALFDVPIGELAARFGHVELVDMVHPRRARRLTRAYSNVSLRDADITGIAARLAAGGRPPHAGPPIALADDTDLVISANVLSQLAVLPCAWLTRRCRINETQRQSLAQELLDAHLDWLSGLPARVCLVTETERVYYDPQDRRVKGWDALHGIALPPPEAVWDWDIAPDGETAKGFTHRNTIHGYSDFTAAVARSETGRFDLARHES